MNGVSTTCLRSRQRNRRYGHGWARNHQGQSREPMSGASEEDLLSESRLPLTTPLAASNLLCRRHGYFRRTHGSANLEQSQSRFDFGNAHAGLCHDRRDRLPPRPASLFALRLDCGNVARVDLDAFLRQGLGNFLVSKPGSGVLGVRAGCPQVIEAVSPGSKPRFVGKNATFAERKAT